MNDHGKTTPIGFNENNSVLQNDVFRSSAIFKKASVNISQYESTGGISVKKIVTAFKPPHRYSILCDI